MIPGEKGVEKCRILIQVILSYACAYLMKLVWEAFFFKKKKNHDIQLQKEDTLIKFLYYLNNFVENTK